MLLLCLSCIGCGQAVHLHGVFAVRTGTPALAKWTGRVHVRRVVDLSAPLPGGAIAVATNGRLALLTSRGALRPIASGYAASPGLEPYIALSLGQRVRGARCAFPAGALYALALTHSGVTEVTASGAVRLFARLPGAGLENGIAFDGTGRFRHRLLVTATAGSVTSVYAIDCRGHVATLTRSAPKVEGGLAVAPATFGSYAGDLIAPAEVAGLLYAINRAGQAKLLAASGVPHGQDVGVESEGFVPARFGEALVSDRLTPRNRHPGDDLILALPRRALAAEGVRTGDLLVVTEGGANTIDVRCGATCAVHEVATGPPEAHIEGHVVFRLAR